MPLPRPCKKCGKRFLPEFGFTKYICPTCRNYVRFINLQNLLNHRLGKPKIPLWPLQGR